MTSKTSRPFAIKTGYFTQVENKYVFNVSLIFWHVFIVLASVAIAMSLVVLLWSMVPASQKRVVKQAYPGKGQYPAPVKVGLSELQVAQTKEEAPPVAPEPTQATTPASRQPPADTRGKAGYDSTLGTLRGLIPPAKYSWQGSGSWTYPFGERYWTVYKQEKYRHWNATEPGIEEKLNTAYGTANASSFADKRQMLDGYIDVVKLIAEENRLSALQGLMGAAGNSVSANVSTCGAISRVTAKMPKESGNVAYIGRLAMVGKSNPSGGPLFIDYIATIIERFAAPQRAEIIDRLTVGYNSYFGRNLSMLKEATDLFLPLVGQIDADNQPKTISQYYSRFRSKNFARDSAIALIENEYQLAVSEIDQQHTLNELLAQKDFLSSKATKAEFRLKSMMGIAGGVLLIVLTAVVLVFFSIQRSIRLIEERVVAGSLNQ